MEQLTFNGTNGAYPVAGVIQAKNGTLYGTSTDRGTAAQGKVPFGTIFTITACQCRGHVAVFNRKGGSAMLRVFGGRTLKVKLSSANC